MSYRRWAGWLTIGHPSGRLGFRPTLAGFGPDTIAVWHHMVDRLISNDRCGDATLSAYKSYLDQAPVVIATLPSVVHLCIGLKI